MGKSLGARFFMAHCVYIVHCSRICYYSKCSKCL